MQEGPEHSSASFSDSGPPEGAHHMPIPDFMVPVLLADSQTTLPRPSSGWEPEGGSADPTQALEADLAGPACSPGPAFLCAEGG